MFLELYGSKWNASDAHHYIHIFGIIIDWCSEWKHCLFTDAYNKVASSSEYCFENDSVHYCNRLLLSVTLNGKYCCIRRSRALFLRLKFKGINFYSENQYLPIVPVFYLSSVVHMWPFCSCFSCGSVCIYWQNIFATWCWCCCQEQTCSIYIVESIIWTFFGPLYSYFIWCFRFCIGKHENHAHFVILCVSTIIQFP